MRRVIGCWICTVGAGSVTYTGMAMSFGGVSVLVVVSIGGSGLAVLCNVVAASCAIRSWTQPADSRASGSVSQHSVMVL